MYLLQDWLCTFKTYVHCTAYYTGETLRHSLNPKYFIVVIFLIMVQIIRPTFMCKHFI